MDEPNENGFGWEPYVWRGTLGGAIGNLIVVLLWTVYTSLRIGSGPLLGLLILGSVALVSGTIAGGAIGLLVFQVSRKWGRQLNMVLRMLIGSICFLAYLLLIDLTNRSFPFAFTLSSAVLVGGLAGLMARAKVASDSVPLTARRA